MKVNLIRSLKTQEIEHANRIEIAAKIFKLCALIQNIQCPKILIRVQKKQQICPQILKLKTFF